MKKMLSLMLVTTMLFSLAACGNNNAEQAQFEDTEINVIEAVEMKQDTEINITIGDTVATAWLDDSETSRQFIELLPQEISMTRGRERVYYGSINNGFLTYNGEDVVTEAVSSDLAYWFSGNSLSLFFNVTEGNSDVNSGIVVFGKITSDLSVFYDMAGNETMTVALAQSETEDPTQEPVADRVQEIALAIGDTVVIAELDGSEIANQFADSLPQTISMTRGEEREYYGRIEETLDYNEDDITTVAEDGDLSYWFSGNSLAFFFDTSNKPEVNSGIVTFGRITSDLSVFDNMANTETVVVTLLE